MPNLIPKSRLSSALISIWKSHLHERLKMLQWRIASQLLPTKDILNRFMNNQDQRCPLCKNEQESVIHIFLLCLVAKALQFGSNWGIHSELLLINGERELIDFILNPPFNLLARSEESKSFSVYGALILDAIWKLRNQVFFEKKNTQLEDLLRIFNKLFLEHSESMQDNFSRNNIRIPTLWSNPARGQVKLNRDAPVGPNHSVIVVVARDLRGLFVFALSKKINTNVHVQTEA